MVRQQKLASLISLPLFALADNVTFPFDQLAKKDASAKPTFDYIGYEGRAKSCNCTKWNNILKKEGYDEETIGTSVFIAKPVSISIGSSDSDSSC